MSDTLIANIKKTNTHIGIIGLGYVGIPLALRFLEKGFKVTGFDVDKNKIEALKSGLSYIRHISLDVIVKAYKEDKFVPTDDFKKLSEPDCLIICVPTPLTDKLEPDLGFVKQTAEMIAGRLRPGQLIALESTTYPGTTDEILLPMFENTGLKAGKDFFLIFSPEREDPGNANFSTRTIPKVVGGVTKECRKAGEALYSSVIDKVVVVSSTRVAEMTKLLENIFRSVNIALVNELKILCDHMGINLWEVIKAASTKPFGFTPFYPGPGLGGHCIPIDPFYLAWKAKEYNFATRFIELAGEINTSMPSFVVNKIQDALNNKEKSLKGSRILILGVAYKKDVDDDRESPAYHIMDLLQKKGATILYNDPLVLQLKKSRKHDFGLSSMELTPELLSGIDAAIIVTDHSAYDYNFICMHAPIVVDTRNATDGLEEIYGGKIVRA